MNRQNKETLVLLMQEMKFEDRLSLCVALREAAGRTINERAGMLHPAPFQPYNVTTRLRAGLDRSDRREIIKE